MKLGFRAKLLGVIASSIGVTAILLIIIGSLSARNGLRAEVEGQLRSQGNTIKTNVTEHAKRLRNYAAQVSDSRLIEGMFIAYEGALYGSGLVPGKDLEAFTPSFQNLNKSFLARVQTMAEDFAFDDIILASTNGQVVFAIAKDKDVNVYLGKNLISGVFKETKLGECYRKAKESKERALIFSGTSINSISGQMESFLCQGKAAEFDYASDGIKKGDVLGVVISRISMGVFTEMASWRFGEGDTGVSYIVGPDYFLRTNYINKNNNVTGVESLKDKREFKTTSIEDALKGKEGMETTKNPFAKDVMSFYVPIEFFGHSWALIVEKETDEIYSSVHAMIYKLAGVGALIFLAVLGISYLYLDHNVKSLVRIGEQMDESCVRISQNGGQLKQSSEEMSEGATMGAASLEQTVSSLTEVSSMVDNNSQNANEAYKLSVSNLESAKAGSEKISRLIESMRAVAEKSERIEQISAVIEDIAFQTNLLALNASVEAARAGEQGKGFAVVADAVRNLAQKSSQSAKEISDLIQSTVEIAVAGRSEADESGLVLQRIVDAIEKASKINQSIAEASREQATGVREISTTMNNIDQITQKNAALASSLKDSSDNLSLESEVLKEVFSRLHLILKGS